MMLLLLLLLMLLARWWLLEVVLLVSQGSLLLLWLLLLAIASDPSPSNISPNTLSPPVPVAPTMAPVIPTATASITTPPPPLSLPPLLLLLLTSFGHSLTEKDKVGGEGCGGRGLTNESQSPPPPAAALSALPIVHWLSLLVGAVVSGAVGGGAVVIGAVVSCTVGADAKAKDVDRSDSGMKAVGVVAKAKEVGRSDSGINAAEVVVVAEKELKSQPSAAVPLEVSGGGSFHWVDQSSPLPASKPSKFFPSWFVALLLLKESEDCLFICTAVSF